MGVMGSPQPLFLVPSLRHYGHWLEEPVALALSLWTGPPQLVGWDNL